MESTVIIALITALAAIVSPVITALINNYYNHKMKEIDAKEERLRTINLHEREVLENALSGLGTLMGWSDINTAKEAEKSVLVAVAYVDSTTGEKLRSVVQSIGSNKPILIEEYSDICKALKAEIAKRTVES